MSDLKDESYSALDISGKKVELFHVITLEPGYLLKHAISSSFAFNEISSDFLLLQPHELERDFWKYAAVRAPSMKCFDQEKLKSDVKVGLKLFIVDELENKPLFLHQTRTRSILILAEIINGIFSSLHDVGIKPLCLTPYPQKNAIEIQFLMPKDVPLDNYLGALMCLVLVIDSLLFERGLKIETLKTDFNSTKASSQKKFFNACKKIMANLHAPHF